MKEYTGLSKIRNNGFDSLYCPKCGNSLKVINNGLFNGELFYCFSCNKLFNIALRDITNTADDDFLKKQKEDVDIVNVRKSIDEDNYERVKEFLNKH